jgi:hypothetical protein
MALLLAIAVIGPGWSGPVARTASADCGTNHITLYKDWFGNGPAQTFCLELTGNLPNLAAVPGVCNGTWNDCASSTRVSLGQTQCFALYSAANYVGLMEKYWGAMGPDVLDPTLNPNDGLSSMRQYTKTPTPATGNC